MAYVRQKKSKLVEQIEVPMVVPDPEFKELYELIKENMTYGRVEDGECGLFWNLGQIEWSDIDVGVLKRMVTGIFGLRKKRSKSIN